MPQYIIYLENSNISKKRQKSSIIIHMSNILTKYMLSCKIGLGEWLLIK